MTAKGHVLLATALVIQPVIYIYQHFSGIIAIESLLIVIFASLLNDIDEPKSYIGTKFIFLAYFLKLLGIEHRTLTHWLITPFIIFAIALVVVNIYLKVALFSIAFGVLAHDIGDLLTYGGIRGFFFPCCINKRAVLLPHFLRFETFSSTEMIFNIFLFGSIFMQGFYFYGEF